MPSAASTSAMIEEFGQTVILRRIADDTPATDLEVSAVLHNNVPVDLVEDIIQGDRLAIIANDEIEAASWPGPPRTNDQIVIDGKTNTIQFVETVKLRGEIVRHNIMIRG